MTATSGAFGRSSSSLIVRPRIGSTRSTGKIQKRPPASSVASLHPRLSGSQSGRPPTPRPVRAFGCRAANRARSPARRSCGCCCPRLVHHDQVLALWIRQRPQQQLIDDREDGGVGADAKRERKDDGNREAGVRRNPRPMCRASRITSSKKRPARISWPASFCLSTLPNLRRASSRASASLMPRSRAHASSTRCETPSRPTCLRRASAR